MVVAIFQRTDAAWFFKVSGDPEEVKKAEPAWQAFFESVRFEQKSGGETPAWDLPEGWKSGGKAQMVFAILEMPDSDLQVRVSRLGGQQDLLSNINRWRGQLALDPIGAAVLDDNVSTAEGKVDYRLFDQEGKLSGKSMGGPFMRRQAQKSTPTETPPSGKAEDLPSEHPVVGSPSELKNDFESNPKFTLESPTGYSVGKTSTMVVARFLREAPEGKVQISVVPLTPTNMWHDNVNFWRQSVGLEPSDEKQIDEATETVTIGGIEGLKIKLLAVAGDEPLTDESRSLIGVMVKREDAAWFFKMLGNHEMVKTDQDVFDEFLKSFKFAETE